MVRAWIQHAAYRQWLRQQLTLLPAEIREKAHLWKDELFFAWNADLDTLGSTICRHYSRTGRPARDPAAMLRCMLLMTFCRCRRITDWVTRLRREPVLNIACGFPVDDLPGASTCLDFLDRLAPGPRRRYALRRPSARRLRLRPGEKLPPKRRGLLNRLVRRLMRTTETRRDPGAGWNELLLRTALASVERGLIPNAAAMTVAGDGTHLESGCYSHGHKTCECPKSRPCDHPRRYTDPGALNGWDSYRSRCVVGRTLFTVAEAESENGLPLSLVLSPGNRHDSLSGAIAVHGACLAYRHSPIALRRGLFDCAHEGEPFLRLCHHDRLDPIVARAKRGAKPKAPVARRLAKHGIRLDPHGVPVCAANLPMRSHGRSKPHVWTWTCPLAGKCPTPCNYAHSALCLNATQDPRALTPTPRATPARARLFKRRTAVERWHAWLDLSEVQNALHRRDHLWWGRCGLAALVWHMRLWGGDLPSGWVQSLLNP